MISTCGYSFVSQAFDEDEIEKIISLMETFVGMGNATGPILGSFVYHFVGFQWTFFGFGLLMIPASCLIVCALPTPLSVREKNINAKL